MKGFMTHFNRKLSVAFLFFLFIRLYHIWGPNYPNKLDFMDTCDLTSPSEELRKSYYLLMLRCKAKIFS